MRKVILNGVVVLALTVAAAGGAVSTHSSARGLTAVACSSGYVTANLSWGTKCLRVGEYCKVGNPEYQRYGFNCPASGSLSYLHGGATTTAPRSSSTPPSSLSPALGATVLLAPRTRSNDCLRGALPDRRCSPGAYSSRLTKAVICSPGVPSSVAVYRGMSGRRRCQQAYRRKPPLFPTTP